MHLVGVSKQNYAKRKLNMLISGRYKDNIDHMMFDNVALYSFTNMRITEHICKSLYSLPDITKASRITDAMAGAGGDTLTFARYFIVTAIECNVNRCDMLRHNINIFGFNNVTIVNDYYQNVKNNLVQDIIYFDPPWGGPDYKYYDSMKLVVPGPDGKQYSLESMIAAMQFRALYCVVKLPFNYDVNHFHEYMEASKVGIMINTFDYSLPFRCIIKIIRYKN